VIEFKRYRLDNGEGLGGAHHRYIQPPQIGFFVTTTDKLGNTNVTPVTMGTCIAHKYFSFTLSNLMVEEWDQEKYPFRDGIKQGYCNLSEVPECVISYYGHSLLRESWIAGMPIPKGISEIDVMGLTPLPSQIVKPCGIAECPINLEAKVLYVHKLGEKWMNYICEVVQVTVHKTLEEQNKTGPLAGYGVLIIDPLFEVLTGKGTAPETDNFRLVYDRLDLSKIERCPEDVGCKDHWIGSFKQWIQDEHERGKISAEEVKLILELEDKWAANRNPVQNDKVKAELTALLKKAVAKIN
jgi:flavin reductase (DIM6/NTAB) family NADH-FMN oxidoreductase RutF